MRSPDRNFDETEIRELFNDQKFADRRHSPDFEALWRPISSRTGRADEEDIRVRPILAAAGLAAVVLVMALAVFQSDRTAEDERLDIFAWRSPTANLLQPMNGELMTTVPHFGKPFFPM